MKRSTFISLLGTAASGAVATTAASRDRTPVEVAEDAEICALAAKLMNDYAAAHFQALVPNVHPTTLKFFRDWIATGYEQLSERFGEARVIQASGLEAHPRILSMTNSSFFVHAMEVANRKHPAFTACPPERETKIIGGIIDPQGLHTFAHVLSTATGQQSHPQAAKPKASAPIF